ncbi:ATP-dependent RNA helicase [Yamadazyma tenuis]|uniref:RNA helicase n=1 Tax=Candida tenuis (strain ATCC 10573 / BCRC 21748 / CBS 615 / JCM 9827 / NBRC 10315 / NRRL Y-1498 / VKM Y-70) TaxID=590646 RepID=G3B4W1_CANTC|nr:P-loop containing nucleoside triphosphate hydrolase protein [Yamadazyma tenuis ATCC 10573]EGV64000.1 P-loop containing nucleoside triphosphate hydrolase protein [Yamadazyma tenuis ATCC 10573]WEJ96380.1 ATP-dependent RNA helicase [Yamadazyma tenuis]
MAPLKKQKSKYARKPRASLKNQMLRESRVVKADSLKWKPVEIPDNLDNYEGLYGLEEIDGVDVEIVNGQAQFKVKDDKKFQDKQEKKKQKNQNSKDNKSPDNDESMEIDGDETQIETEEEVEEEEFTGFDDEVVQEQPQTANELDEELVQSAFDFNVELPDDNISLPHWSSLSLSGYALTGLNELKFTSPTPIQKKSIPLGLEGRDIIGKATTGSGKTLAYGIPILEKYLSNLETIKANRKNGIINSPTGIVFVPTRELAHQVVDHLNNISKFYPLPPNGIVSITGGLSIQKQERLLKFGPGLIVATPGRFLELSEKDEELLKRWSSTDIVVLDEADRLLQDGHFDEFEKILELFKKHRPGNLATWKWQTLVFSATFARELFGKLSKTVKAKDQTGLIENDEILKLLNEKLHFKDKSPVLIDANPKEIVSGQIAEALVECGATERDLYLYYFLLVYKGSTLVFANSIDSVKRLVPFLNSLNIPAFAIHSSMIQKQRMRSLERFKEATAKNSISVLVASDVAARGLDIPNIDHVAHYHLPRSADVYIHRSGRTARAGNEGVSVMFCSPQEASGPLRKLRKLVASNATHTRLNVHSDVKLLPIEENLVSQVRPRVMLASKLANAAISNTSSKKENTWVKQAAEDLGIEDMTNIDDFQDDFIKKQKKRNESRALTKDESKGIRYELKQLLSQPLRKLARRSYLTSGLENLAHIMVSGKTHKDILGHQNVNALEDLRGKKQVKPKPKEKSDEKTKQTRPQANKPEESKKHKPKKFDSKMKSNKPDKIIKPGNHNQPNGNIRKNGSIKSNTKKN